MGRLGKVAIVRGAAHGMGASHASFHATTGYLASKMGISEEELYPRVYSTLNIFGREVLPSDVSNAVDFLASEESRIINGTIIYVDGGHLAT